MLTTSTVSGSTETGAVHQVRIGRGFGDVRYIECDTCGKRQLAQFAARDKADQHLTEQHGVCDGCDCREDGAEQVLGPLPWILGAISMLVLVIAVIGASSST